MNLEELREKVTWLRGYSKLNNEGLNRVADWLQAAADQIARLTERAEQAERELAEAQSDTRDEGAFPVYYFWECEVDA